MIRLCHGLCLIGWLRTSSLMKKLNFLFFFFKFFRKKRVYKVKRLLLKRWFDFGRQGWVRKPLLLEGKKIWFFFVEKIQSFWNNFLKKTTNIIDQSSFSSLILLIFWVWFKINFFFFLNFLIIKLLFSGKLMKWQPINKISLK